MCAASGRLSEGRACAFDPLTTAENGATCLALRMRATEDMRNCIYGTGTLCELNTYEHWTMVDLRQRHRACAGVGFVYLDPLTMVDLRQRHCAFAGTEFVYLDPLTMAEWSGVRRSRSSESGLAPKTEGDTCIRIRCSVIQLCQNQVLCDITELVSGVL